MTMITDEMEKIVNYHTAGLGGVGALAGPFGPGTDLPIIGASWVTMTMQLAEEAGHDLDRQTVKKICIAVATGAGSFIAGSKIATTAAGWIAALFTGGASLLVSAAGNAALNAAFTRAYGRACAKYFLQTDEIPASQVAVAALIAMVGAELGKDFGKNNFA